MNILKEKTAKLHISLLRVITSFITLIAGIIGFLFNKKKPNNKKFKVLSIVSIISGISLLIKELESNFKPVDDNELEDDDTADEFVYSIEDL